MKPVERGTAATAVIALVVAIAAVLLSGETLTFLAVSAAIYALLALSMVPTIGGVGLRPLSQLMFAAVGAVVVGATGERNGHEHRQRLADRADHDGSDGGEHQL